MTTTFEVNGKLYKAREFDFNMLCDLEDMGLSLEEIEKKPMSLIRTYFAFCGNLSKDKAGQEIEAHVENGGNFNAVLDVMSEKMSDSGFFRSLNKKSEEETGETSAENPKRSRKKESEITEA